MFSRSGGCSKFNHTFLNGDRVLFMSHVLDSGVVGAAQQSPADRSREHRLEKGREQTICNCFCFIYQKVAAIVLRWPMRSYSDQGLWKEIPLTSGGQCLNRVVGVE